MIGVEINAKGVSAGIDHLITALPDAAARANMDAANEVMRLSQFEVPHDEGTLQNSGTVESLSNGDVVVGYHTKYAARLHEHPEYRFQRGRKGKYLEDPILHNASALGLVFGRSIQSRLF